MTEGKFTQEDKEKMVEFLNKVAKHATFQINTLEMISYYKSLAFMQTVILPKVEANILEVVKVVESDSESTE